MDIKVQFETSLFTLEAANDERWDETVPTVAVSKVRIELTSQKHLKNKRTSSYNGKSFCNGIKNSYDWPELCRRMNQLQCSI